MDRGWFLEQLEKTRLFHRKLHEWGLLELGEEIEGLDGSRYSWDLEELGIDPNAWNKVIHSGIKPVVVFANPDVLLENPKRLAYYRRLAMVSQKALKHILSNVDRIEENGAPLDGEILKEVVFFLNRLISQSVLEDEEVNPRELDMWRAMTAGAQAGGSWRNYKGQAAQMLIWEMVQKEAERMGGELHGDREILLGERKIVFGSEPDIEVRRSDDGTLLVAVEIKGGTDPAGVHERYGAAKKSLERAKEERFNAWTVLVVDERSLTPRVEEEIKDAREIDFWFKLGELLTDDMKKQEFLGIVLGNDSGGASDG